MSTVIQIPQDPAATITIGLTPVVGGAQWGILHLDTTGTLVNVSTRFVYNEDTNAVTLDGTMIATQYTDIISSSFPRLTLGPVANTPYTTVYIASANNDGGPVMTLEMDAPETMPFILGQFINGIQSWKINHDGSFDWTHLNDVGSGDMPHFYFIDKGGVPTNTLTPKGWLRVNEGGSDDRFIPYYN